MTQYSCNQPKSDYTFTRFYLEKWRGCIDEKSNYTFSCNAKGRVPGPKSPGTRPLHVPQLIWPKVFCATIPVVFSTQSAQMVTFSGATSSLNCTIHPSTNTREDEGDDEQYQCTDDSAGDLLLVHWFSCV